MRPWDPHQKSESNIVFLKLEQLFALVVDQGGPLIGDDHVNDSILAIHHLSWYLSDGPSQHERSGYAGQSAQRRFRFNKWRHVQFTYVRGPAWGPLTT